MESIVQKIPFFVLDDCEIRCLMIEDEPWFNSIDLCKALGFSSKQARNQALTSHVHDDDKTHLKSLLCQVKVNVFIDLTVTTEQLIMLMSLVCIRSPLVARSLLRGYSNVGLQARSPVHP